MKWCHSLFPRWTHPPWRPQAASREAPGRSVSRRRSEMIRTPPALAILALTLLAGFTLVATEARAAKYVYNCVLTGKQEVGPTASTGSGGGRFVIDTDA